jgi:hypothetical protein
VAAAAAVAAGLAAVVGLVRLIRSGAPGLDPIRSPRPHGGGFVRLNLLACHLASVAWLLAQPAGLPLWGLLPAVGGWSLGLALWAAPAWEAREERGTRAGTPRGGRDGDGDPAARAGDAAG